MTDDTPSADDPHTTDGTATAATPTDDGPTDAADDGGENTGDASTGLETEDHPPETVHNDLAPRASASEAAEEGSGFSIDRRSWLQSLAAALVGAGVGSSILGSASAEAADTSLTVDERIQEHRTGDLEVVVENADGSAVEGASVSVSQQEHEFGFGTAVNAQTLINESSEGDNYREYVSELFNKAVMENRHKWAFFENEQQLADDATDWVLDQDLDMRGHVCIWGREDVSAIPSDIQTAIDNGDEQTIRDRSMQHIEDIITHYGDDLTEWEVVNEVMHTYELQLGVYGDQIDTEEPWTGDVVPWTSDLLADWYSQAAQVIDENGYDLGIAVNDFNHFAYDYTDSRYQTQIEHLNQNAVQLDTVGLQAHAAARTGENETNDNPDGRIPASQVAEEMNQWADYGARLKITEFDTYNGDDWNSDEERADVLENYLRGAFSHPGCDDFIMWGFWDGRHWENEAPLFYEDWSQKPAYDVWDGLVYGEWWTDDSGTTDGSGSYATTAFLGEHEISVSTDSDAATTTTAVTDADGTTTITVVVDGEGNGGENDTQAPTTPTNLSATDATSSSITVSWDGVTDNGASGLDHYDVYLDGSQTQQVPAGTTMATVDGLSANSDYEIGVSATDGAGNESDVATVTASTDADDDGTGGDLIASIDPGTTEAGTGDLVQFWITDETPGGSWITSLEWDLGNGSTDSGWYADVRYQSAGSYTVTLTATDNDGNTSTDEVTVTIS